MPDPNSLFQITMKEPDKPQESLNEVKMHDYWVHNLRIMAWLLVVWFVVSFGCGIIWVEQLNKIQIGGFKLGFWFAQQGSIYCFVVLIFVYVRLMNKLDHKYDVEEE